MDDVNNTLDNITSLKIMGSSFSGLKDFYFWSSSFQNNKLNKKYTENIELVTGYSVEEILNLPEQNFALVIEEDIKKVKILFDEFLRNEEDNLKLTYRIRKKDHSVIWVEENLYLTRNHKGEILNINGIVKDITDQKEKESELLKIISRLEENNNSKDKFISILSHDLRAPFTSILGFCEILINEQNLNKTEALEYLNYIHSSSQNQLKFINYLLEWSRLQTGRMKLDTQRLNAKSVIYNCIASLTGDAVRKNIDIKVNVTETLVIQADERLFSQVIVHLLSNAIKFSNEGQNIEINADIFNDDFAEFIVNDKGMGISESNKDKLFKIDKMFSTEGSKGEKGTGLGLTLVKEIIDKHNGTIWFYSNENEGSEFHFTLPLSPNTILVVDDDPAERGIYEKVIQEKFPSYKVVGTENAYRALEIVLDKTPSLVITANEMPLMNGINFLENIRKEDRNFNIPVIVFADTVPDELKSNLNSLGVSIILQKPVNTDILCERLQSILN